MAENSIERPQTPLKSRAVPLQDANVTVDLKSPVSSPQSMLKSPTFTPSSLGTSYQVSSSPSPLLLAVDEVTPLNPRDEESALYSDSDGASQISALPSREERRKGRKKSSSGKNRRRKSDSEKSGRSARSSSGQRDKIPQTTKIFRNLLVLEESLRQQYKEQKSLRRKFTMFLAILAGLEGFVIYLLYFTSPVLSQFRQYSMKFSAFFILVTLVLFHLSGEYRRTIVIPRRFFNSMNKGIRQLNLRLVKVKSPMSDKVVDFIRYSLSIIHYWCSNVFQYSGPLKRTFIGRWIELALRKIELTSQPRIGATDLKLVLNPRSFNSEIREAWELYRDEFWSREGAKRRQLSNGDEKSKQVMNKESLVEKHRQQRKNRRKSKLDEKSLLSSK